MKKINPGIIVTLLVSSLISLQGCATEQPSLKIEDSLPASKLAYYNDSFDKMREDIWEKAGFIYQKEQLRNYKYANMQVQNGQLIIKTQIGSFSKGGLVAKYCMKGDFDIQIDSEINFLRGAQDLDQILSFAVLEKGPVPEKKRLLAISLIKVGQEGSGIFSSYRGGRVILGKSWYPTGNFRGSLRIVRAGNKVSTYYKKEGGSWKKRDTFPSSGGHARVGLVVQNYAMQRTSIHATAPVIGKLDNFRINAAQDIIEEEI
jgi:hypothetical protein